MDKVTRIKYIEKDGLHISTKKFLGNDGVLLSVEVCPKMNTVSVVEYKENGYITPVEVMPAKSFKKAKAMAKGLLKKYGVNFFEEVRKSKGEPTAPGTDA